MRRLIIRIILMMSVCTVFSGCSGKTDPGNRPEGSAQADTGYGGTLFDHELVHRIDINISYQDWEDLLKNPVDKTKYKADAVIDGEKIEDVLFATKGNSSLIFVAADPDSSRYSFRIDFGKYAEGQTYHGLNKLSLNNSYHDATYMKDYLSYEIFRQAGVPAPLTSYLWLTVNGKDQGLYLAVEDEGESFLGRVNEGKRL